MRQVMRRGKLGRFIEWQCCGLIWQLYPRIWRGKPTWVPTCPRCGGTLRREVLETTLAEREGM
jgi:hypothetical protein